MSDSLGQKDNIRRLETPVEQMSLAIMGSSCQRRLHIKTSFSPFLILLEARPLCVT